MVASRFPSRPFQLRENVWLIRQDGNSSLVGWQLWIDKLSYSPTYSGGRAHRWMKINGATVHQSYGNGFDFRNGDNFLLAQGEAWVGHEWNGYKTFAIEAWAGFDILGDASFGTSFTLPRIPKTPSQPAQATLSHFTPTSVRVNGSSVDDMGAPIEEWQFAATPTSAGGSQVIYSHNGPVLDCGNLVPGVSYRFQYRARNRQGWGPWSPDAFGTPGLPAPNLTSWTQIVGDVLRATWTAPSTTTGLTGYRLQVATNAVFTTGVVTIDVGKVTTADASNLAGGRRYWARVAALTAGGANAWSNARDVMLVLDSGDLDGWTRTNARPESIAYFTNSGIRRAITGGAQALLLESVSTAPGQIPANTLGIQRTLTGLRIGAAYRVAAKLTGAYTGGLGPGQASAYRLGVDGYRGDAVSLVVSDATVPVPPLEFVATGDTAILQILLADALTIATGGAEVERVALTGITVSELDTDYPQRLRNTVYESNLANHFDLACNSVGAIWYVAKDGVTRFNPPGTALPVSAVFADTRSEGVLEYVDISAGYDTRGTINRINATNYGLGDDGLEENDTLAVSNEESQARYGVLSTDLNVNLYDQYPYDTAFASRLNALLAEHAHPELFVSEIRWNAQQDLAALTALEIAQRIRVHYRGRFQDSQIVALDHDVQPTRWITTLTLRKL